MLKIVSWRDSGWIWAPVQIFSYFMGLTYAWLPNTYKPFKILLYSLSKPTQSQLFIISQITLKKFSICIWVPRVWLVEPNAKVILQQQKEAEARGGDRKNWWHGGGAPIMGSELRWYLLKMPLSNSCHLISITIRGSWPGHSANERWKRCGGCGGRHRNETGKRKPRAGWFGSQLTHIPVL